MKNKTVIVYFGEPTEAFANLRRFCKAKGLKYNTWKQKKEPWFYKERSVEKMPLKEKFECIEIYGELIKIQ